MLRPARIISPVAIGQTLLTFAAESDEGPLQVRVALTSWEQLRMAMPYLDDEDRRDAALLELEQLCTTDRIRLADGERIADIMASDVDDVVARMERSIER